VTDTYLSTAQPGLDTWNIITGGSKRFRISPGSQPPAIVQTDATPARSYDIHYYSRDVRRNPDPSRNIPIEESFDSAGKALLVGPRLEANVPPASTGAKMTQSWWPAEEGRYDKKGTRNTMTTSFKAMEAELAEARPNHLPRSASFTSEQDRVRTIARNRWAYTHAGEW
jgi:hypothetical protein